MEKTLTIDGKEVRFRSTGATPLRFKAQFGKDYFVELMKMQSLQSLQNGDATGIESIEFDGLYNIVWTLAKTADKTIPEPIEWLDGFDEFPLFDILPELQDLIMKSLQTSKKK